MTALRWGATLALSLEDGNDRPAREQVPGRRSRDAASGQFRFDKRTDAPIVATAAPGTPPEIRQRFFIPLHAGHRCDEVGNASLTDGGSLSDLPARPVRLPIRDAGQDWTLHTPVGDRQLFCEVKLCRRQIMSHRLTIAADLIVPSMVIGVPVRPAAR